MSTTGAAAARSMFRTMTPVLRSRIWDAVRGRMVRPVTTHPWRRSRRQRDCPDARSESNKGKSQSPSVCARSPSWGPSPHCRPRQWALLSIRRRAGARSTAPAAAPPSPRQPQCRRWRGEPTVGDRGRQEGSSRGCRSWQGPAPTGAEPRSVLPQAPLPPETPLCPRRPRQRHQAPRWTAPSRQGAALTGQAARGSPALPPAEDRRRPSGRTLRRHRCPSGRSARPPRPPASPTAAPPSRPASPGG
mmetsp:Transcript_33155/g.84361  ORF Transcript_33155/g.84361 Transcript_33155/m.84361 type:complete len:246 (-) Transcript_33155:906-1643(-)